MTEKDLNKEEAVKAKKTPAKKTVAKDAAPAKAPKAKAEKVETTKEEKAPAKKAAKAVTASNVKLSWKTVDVSSLAPINELKDLKLRADLVARVINWQLAKRRAGTHDTKEEAEVRGSGKKIYRQKGTGGARQGSKRGPHFRGGSVIFGPTPRDHGYSLQKKVRKLALKHAVASKLQDSKIYIFEDLNVDTFKTRDLKANISALFNTNKVLFVDQQNDNLLLGVRNIIGADVIPAEGLNVYDIIRHEALVMTRATAEAFIKRVASNG